MAHNDVDKDWELEGYLSDDMESISLVGAKTLKRLFTPLVGKTLLVGFKVLRYKRTAAQNRYIHGVMVPVVRAWILETEGEKKTHDEVYLWLRTGVLGHKPVISEIKGIQVISMTGKRFSEMNTKEFAEAINTIADELAKQDCYIPMPKEKGFGFITEHLED